jgi:demethylmenaquinone methyltransferase/2-methoxy-6-polyprenyl-1,4-benzoquinol methylase
MRQKRRRKETMTHYNKNQPETIQEMFGSIAKRYDLTNAVLSLQMHKFWNAQLVKKVSEKRNISSLLDLCCGTGDIAFAFLKGQNQPHKAMMLDFCGEMLACAKKKAANLKLNYHNLSYLEADAQSIPLPSDNFPCATMAYGIRNIKDPLKCFHEVYRVLEPGGIFGILELTRPENKLIRCGHRIYLKTVLPLFGKWLTTNEEAYQYLRNSIDHFTPPAQLVAQLAQAGFTGIRLYPLTLGTATIFIGHKQKPMASPMPNRKLINDPCLKN